MIKLVLEFTSFLTTLQASATPTVISSSQSGMLVMDKSFEELADVAKVYIISEVVFAETVIVEVDTKKKSEASEMKRIPVAFSYFKFPMNTEGVLQAGTDKVNKDADFLLIEEIEKI